MNFSYWESQFLPNRADLTIIGGGITGLSTAFFFKSKFPKKKVIVIEQFSESTGASTRNAGFACFGSISELNADLEAGLNTKELEELVMMRIAGLSLLRRTLGDEAIDYKPVGGYELFKEPKDEVEQKFGATVEYFNERLTETLHNDQTYSFHQVPEQFRGFKTAIYNCGEGKLNAGFMMKAWQKKCLDLGVEFIYGHQAEISKHSSTIFIKNHKIESEQLAICTNGYSHLLGLNIKVRPARNLVLLSEALPNLKLPSTYHHNEGFIYFRIVNQRLLIGGARNIDQSVEETHLNEVNETIKNHLLHFSQEHLNLSKRVFRSEWTGIMGVDSTKSPIVKRISPNVVCGVKLGGMGVAIGSLVGHRLAELLS